MPKHKINIKNTIKENFLQGKDIIAGLEEYDAFSDWDLDDSSHLIFKEFYNQYPRSKFILNTRSIESWLNSREKHVLRNQRRKKDNPSKDIQWLTVDREAWSNHYERHHKSVHDFFEDKKNELLFYDVTLDEGWKPLCEFLGCEEPSKAFPRANVTPSKLKEIFRRIRTKVLRL